MSADVISTDPVTIDRVERLTTERLQSLSALARELGKLKGDRPRHPTTLARYALKGVRTKDGRVIRLESITLSGRLFSSRPALIRFLAAQQATQSDAPPHPLRGPTARRRESEIAGEDLNNLIRGKSAKTSRKKRSIAAE